MVSIDKTQETARLILTLSEMTTRVPVGFLMVLHSTFTNKSYQVLLGENISQNISRYDEFLLEGQLFKDMEEGRYQYAVSALYDGDITETVEKGLLKITGAKEDCISIETSDAANDYVSI